MKYKFYVLIYFFIVYSGFLTAQVTIGAGEESVTGALLQLKNIQNVTDGSENANKGMMMPRVSITDLTKLYPMFPVGYDTAENERHTGLTVYNIHEDTSGSTPIKKGIYVWDGAKWINLSGTSSNSGGTDLGETGVLIGVNQSKFLTLSGKTSWGLLMQNQQTTITPSYIIGVWSPFTTAVSDILTSTLGDDGALLVEKADIGIPTFWRIGFEFEMGNNPPTQTRYFKVDIVDNDSGNAVFSQAIVVPGGLDTGHTAPFSLFFSTLSDTAANHKGYKIVFGVDTAASAGLPNNISVRVTQILKID
ncbi:MAG: hypothetical protein LBV71_06170 [Prevotella sp.]|jgi:hypothetical protein|nr:hypothetical protein [Prevotella sp.]